MWTIGFLLAVAFVASAELYKDSSLRPGTEYIYKYESQVLSGIPGTDNQYSGVRIVCDVKLQFKHDSLTVLKFDSIRFCEINEHLKTMLPGEMLGDVVCIPASEHTRVIEEELRKPISFRWTSGLVSHLESDVSDPHWSVNVKRGVLNLLHLSLKPETESRDFSGVELLHEYSSHNLLSRDYTTDKAFLIREHDVMGKCESLYSIHGLGKGESFKVSKVKDYRNCHDKVVYEQGLFSGISSWLFLPKDERRDVIKPLTCTEYELMGDRHAFLIRSAKLRSKYIFTPFTTEGGSFVTYMRQHLELETTLPIGSPISVSRPVLHASALELHIPHSLATISKHSLGDKSVLGGEYVTGDMKTGVYGDRDMYTGRRHYKTLTEETRFSGKFRGALSEETSEEVSRMIKDTKESETSEESDELMGMSRGVSSEESDEEMLMGRRYGGQYKTTEDTRTYFRKSRDPWGAEEDILDVDETTGKVSEFKTLLKEIVASMHPFITEETATKIILLSRRLQYLTSSELTTLVMHYGAFSDGVSEVRKIREILLDVLPTLPKPIVPKIIKTLAVKGFIYPKRAAYMISLYSLTAPPTPAVLHSLLTVCRSPEFTGLDLQILRTCWLGAGSITHKLYTMHIKTRVPKSFSMDVIEQTIKEFRALVSSSREDKRQLGIFAMGNSGLPEFLPDIKRIVSDKSLPLAIRQFAIASLRRTVLISPGQSLKIVLPILMNTREPSALRMTAFLIACYANPHRVTLELMVHRLRHDNCVELKSFAYSFLSSSSKSTIPVHKELVHKIKHMLTLMKPVDFGFGHSKGFYFDMFNDVTNIGISHESFMVNTPASYLPTLIAGKLGIMFAHQPVHLFEFGVTMKGMDEVLSNAVYAQSVWKKMLTGQFKLDDFLTPYEFSDFGTVRDSIKSILEKVKIEDRTFDKPEILKWLGIINNQVTYFTTDKSTITDLISRHEMFTSLYTQSPVPFPVDIVKTLPLVDNCIILPTPLGLPITLNLTALFVAHVHGMVTPSNIPSLRDLFFSRSLPAELKVTLDLKPSFAIKTVVSFGVDMTVIKTAVAVKGCVLSHFPLSCQVALKPTEGKLRLTWDIPQTPFIPLKAGVKVVTVLKRLPVRSMPLTFSSKIEKELPQLHSLRTSIPSHLPAIFPALGMRVDIEGQLSRRKAAWVPLHPLACSQHIQVICRPTEERPKAVELKINFDTSSTVPLMDLYESYYKPSSSGYERPMERSYDDSMYGSNKYDFSGSSGRPSFYGEDVEESDFSTVTPWSSISGPRMSRVCLVLKTLGGSTDRRLKALVTWSRSSMYLVHHLNVQVTGSPLVTYYDRPTKFMIDGVLDITKIFNPSSDSLIAKVTLGCGDSAYTTTDLSFKLMAGSTGYSWKSEYSPMYSYITPDVSSSDKFEYYAVINYHNIPLHLMDQITTCFEKVKVLTYPYMYVRKYPGLSGTQTPGQITVYVKCSPVHKKLSAVIKTPTESDIIIDLPSFNPYFSRETLSINVPAPILMTEGFTDKYYGEGVSMSDSSSDYSSSGSYWWKSWTGECRLSESSLRTFDGVSYKLPVETSDACDVIVARDCSHRGLFTVISSPMTYKVKVILPHYEIKVHVEPTTYAYDVKINGIAKEISRPLVLSEYPTESSDDAYEITKEGEVVKIYCVKTGVTIKVGSYVSVKVSSVFRGRLCGLCGNFNGERYDEYEGPSKAVYDRPEHSSLKYYVPGDSCPVSDYYRKYSVPDVTYSGECMTNLRNIVKQTYVRGERLVCFSLEPQRVCSSACRKVGVISKTVAFHCLPAAEASADILIKESRRRPLVELSGKSVDLRDLIETQERCVPGA